MNLCGTLPLPNDTIIPFRAPALPFGVLDASCEARSTSGSVIGLGVWSGCQTELRISTCTEQAQEHGPVPAHERRCVAQAKDIPELTGNLPLDRHPGGRLQPFWDQGRSLEYEEDSCRKGRCERHNALIGLSHVR